MARINIFENIPLFHHVFDVVSENSSFIHKSFFINGVYLPGSLSFNKVNIVLGGGAGITGTWTMSFGLYSLNGTNLSLANSASGSFSNTGLSWQSLATSAAQDITPGNWYFGFVFSTGGNAVFVANAVGFNATGINGGLLVNGVLSVTTGGLPSAIATSDFQKEGTANASGVSGFRPYILISA